jgi:transposase
LTRREPTKPVSKVRCSHCQHVQSVPLSQQTFVCDECGTKLRRLKAPAKGS